MDPKLDFSHLPEIVEEYEKVTRMHVYERQPYAGQLVFAAFSGSHQDAIAKGMAWRETHDCDKWTVPYLAIDPKDLGREYEADVIRINSQSGKGGIGFLLDKTYGIRIPPQMREEVGYSVKGVSDPPTRTPAGEVLEVFKEKYVNINAPIELLDVHFDRRDGGIWDRADHQTNTAYTKYITAQETVVSTQSSNALKRHSEI